MAQTLFLSCPLCPLSSLSPVLSVPVLSVPVLCLSQIAREHGIRFFETSAKANINIEKAFLTLAEDILRKVCVCV